MNRGRIRRLLHQDAGPLTEELRREQGPEGLGQVPARLVPDRTATTVCGFCSTGCALDVHVRDGVAVNLTPTRSYPVNSGVACPKGWESLAPLRAPDRATTPLLRMKGKLEPIDWPTAESAFVERFRAIQAEHGPASVAFLSTGQIPTEEMALLGAFAKFGMGMVHGDGNTRQCMATSVVAYKRSFGFDAPPYTYADFEESDVIVLIGSNLCIAHPILWDRVQRNRHDAEVIVVDPRATETAMAATTHYAPQPKSDLTLLYGLAHLVLRNGWVDEGFVAASTEGFGEFAAMLDGFDPARVSRETGLTVEQLERFATSIGTGERVSFWWTMGVNQSHQGVRTAQAIIDLALMTGNIGRPGTGANSITGQCNAMGSRLFSNTTSLFGGRDFTDATHRSDVAGVLGIDADRIPDQPSLAYDEILEGVLRGTIRGLWIVATNTAHSWVNQTHLREVLSRLNFLVVQDMYATTETALLADLVLPAAGWGEKDGTFINSERRVGRVQRVATPPGDARSDFDIFRSLAAAWGCAEMFRDWSSPEAVFSILQQLSAGRPCDITGIEGYDHLESTGGIQWPYPAGSDEGTATERRLFADGVFFTQSGRARFEFDAPAAVWESTSTRYPLVLLTGRGTTAQWHTGTRTSKSALLRSMAPERLHVEISPVDAEARGISPNDLVHVASVRASIRARAFITASVQPGQVFLPMHDPATNQLTTPSVDPLSRQPSYKWSAVEVRRVRTGE